MPTNHLGQPVGESLEWAPASLPPDSPMTGRTCRLERLDVHRHADDLYAANALDTEGRIWTYMGYGPFDSEADYRDWIESSASADDPFYHAIIDTDSGKALGVASYLRIVPAIGSIEVGHICFSPPLQRTIAATECMYLMMSRAFDELGYRRYEWKCDDKNEKSRSAALRLGFTFEGIFRQHSVYKGRTRDTAWFSIIDREWPAIRDAFEKWLDPGNFDEGGRQRVSLSTLTARENRVGG